MNLVSWNVNGLRAILKKDFLSSLETLNPDVLCLQETKAQEDQVHEALDVLEGYHVYAHSAVRKGYSGTAILSRTKPAQIEYGIGLHDHDQEGRVITADFGDFYLVTVYTPNSGSELKRLDYRQEWDRAFLDFLQAKEKTKPVVVCGDLNVAHRNIDLARPKENYNKSAGFMQEEIDGIEALTGAGFHDTFRHLHPDEIRYTWWSFRAGARRRNVGWRIDYFLASTSLLPKIEEAWIHTDIMGSDHCPVSLRLQRES